MSYTIKKTTWLFGKPYVWVLNEKGRLSLLRLNIPDDLQAEWAAEAAE